MARTAYAPMGEPPKDLHQLFLATQRRKEAAISGNPVPKDVYNNFLYTLLAWVRVQAILDQHIEKMIQLGAGLMEGGNNPAEEGNDATEEGNNPAGLEPLRLEPLPLHRLCPVCFAAGVKTLFLCFDGNFQLRTLIPRGGPRLIELRDLFNCQLFVDKTPTDDGGEKVFRSLRYAKD
jgi:hypothetical protein